MTEFDRATASRPLEEGRRGVTVTDAWDTPNLTRNGGYILALMAEGMSHVSAKRDILSASVNFLKPHPLGDAAVHTEVVREGRRTATALGRLVADGVTTTTATVTFCDRTALDGALDRPDPVPPTLPDPADCIDAFGPVPRGTIKIADHFDYRHAAVPGWAQGTPSGQMEATYWTRFADGREPDDLALLLIPDAYPPVTAEIGVLGSATVQMTVHVRRRPAPGWLLVHVTTRQVADGFHDEDVDIWDATGRLVAQSRQLAIVTG